MSVRSSMGVAERAPYAPAIVFGIGCALSVGGAVWHGDRDAQVATERFAAVAQDGADRLSTRMRLYEYGLRGARGVVLTAGVDELTRAQFLRYSLSRDIDAEFRGARGMGVIKRVPVEQETAFVEHARLDGAPDFSICSLGAHQGERLVIQYIEPVARNRPSVGLDIGSEDRRREAAMAAVKRGAATITAPITLVQATGRPQRSILLLLPVYAPGAPTATETQRMAAAVAWTYAPLVVDEVLADFTFDQAHMIIRDAAARERDALFASAHQAAAEGLVQTLRVPVYGRVWDVEFRATPSFVQNLNQRPPRDVAALGALLSLLVAALLKVNAQRARTVTMARAEQARRAAIVEGSLDAIIGESLDGVITDWNRGAERLFGYSAAEAIGQTATALLLPEDRRGEDRVICAAMVNDQYLPPFDTIRRAKDGTLVDVSITASPVFDADGRRWGFSKTARDIRVAKRAQLGMQELNATLEDQVAQRTALLESARHDLETVLDAVPPMIGYWDKDLRNRVANRAYATWLNSTPAALQGRAMAEVLGSSVAYVDQARLRSALAGEAQTFEVTVPASDARAMQHLLAHYVPDLHEGETRGFYVVVHDVTELTENRNRLSALTREHRSLFSTIMTHAVVSVTDRQGRITEVNDRFCEISGYSREELIGQSHAIVNSGTHGRAFWAKAWREIASGRSWRGEVCNRAKDGKLYWLDSMIAPFMDDDGQPERYVSVRTDITSRKTAEMSLAHERTLMTSLLDTVPDHISFKGPDQSFLRINAALARSLGLADPADAIGRCEADFLSPTRAARSAAVDKGVMRTGIGVPDVEERTTWPDQTSTWSLTTRMPLLDGNRQPIGTFGVSRDISARKQMERELQQTNDRFAIASDAAGIGVWDYDVVRGTLTWDDGMYRLYGRANTGAPAPYDLWSSCLHPDDHARAERELLDALSGAREFDTEFRVVHPNGEVRHLRAAARVMRDHEDRAVRMTGTNFDITDRKRAELELRATSSLLTTVLESASEVAMVATDPDLRITMFNFGAQRLTGYTAAEVVGKATPAIIHDVEELRQRSEDLSRQLGRTIVSGEIFTEPSTLRQPREWTYVKKDGSRVSVSLVVTAMHTEDGTLIGYLCVAHDVTRQKESEHSLRQAVHHAKLANEAKSQFLANMSHEIRTPMNAVIGLTQLLGHTRLDAEQDAFVGKIKVASKSLLAVINDILDLSKIESGELSIEQAPFRLDHLIDELTEVMTTPAEAKGVELRVERGPELPAALIGDSNRVAQILTNLVSNAIKFTERGSVRVRSERVRGSGDRVTLRFSVKDTGIGIAPEVRPRLFTPFAQADASTTRRFGGTGLGLSIVKRLTTLMGGEVGVSSTLGSGTEFWVLLEFEVASIDRTSLESRVSPSNAKALEGTRILLTDDSDINLEVASRLLEREGATVTLARNGQQAVDLLRAGPKDFDLVLLDVQMPVLDGYDATRQIRGELGLARLPIIALTAGVLTTEMERARAAGMNDFISKPVEARVLMRRIRQHLSAPTDHAEQAALPSGAATGWPEIDGIDSDQARVLLGDDRELFLSMLRRVLSEPADFDARLATPASLRSLGAAAHKLAGAAATLSARALYAKARQTEAACRAGRVEEAADHARGVESALAQLRAASEPVLAQRPTASLPAPTAEPIDVEAFGRLMTLLERQDLGALDEFSALSAKLHTALGSETYRQARRQLDALQFSAVSATLGALATM